MRILMYNVLMDERAEHHLEYLDELLFMNYDVMIRYAKTVYPNALVQGNICIGKPFKFIYGNKMIATEPLADMVSIIPNKKTTARKYELELFTHDHQKILLFASPRPNSNQRKKRIGRLSSAIRAKMKRFLG